MSVHRNVANVDDQVEKEVNEALGELQRDLRASTAATCSLCCGAGDPTENEKNYLVEGLSGECQVCRPLCVWCGVRAHGGVVVLRMKKLTVFANGFTSVPLSKGLGKHERTLQKEDGGAHHFPTVSIEL